MINRHRGVGVVAVVLMAIGLLAQAAPARASLTHGTFATPTSGSTISGVETVTFDSQATSVAFSWQPSADNPGMSTVTTANGGAPSGGAVSVPWDTTKGRNGHWDLSAQECDATGCSIVTETVTVDNPIITSTSASFSVPDGATVADNSTITVTGSGSGTLRVFAPPFAGGVPDTYYPENVATGALPLTVSVPYFDDDPAYTAQPIDVSFVLSGASDSITETLNVLPGAIDYSRQPKPIGYAAVGSTYYPASDGFKDAFRVQVASTQVDDVTLSIVSNGSVVSSTTTRVAPPTKQALKLAATYGLAPIYVEAGAGLKPGHYGWFLRVHGTGDPRADLVTPTRAVTALPGRASKHTVTVLRPARSLGYHDASGRCSSTSPRGAGLTLVSNGRCKTGGAAGVALATFSTTLHKQVGFDRLTFKVAITGGPVVLLVYDPVRGALQPPLVIRGRGGHLTLPAEVIDSRNRVQFAIETLDGFHSTVTSVTLVPAYYTVS